MFEKALIMFVCAIFLSKYKNFVNPFKSLSFDDIDSRVIQRLINPPEDEAIADVPARILRSIWKHGQDGEWVGNGGMPRNIDLTI